MLEDPKIPAQQITSCVQADYLLDVSCVTFLPLGYDVNSAVYRIDTREGETYFLKLRKSNFKLVSVALPAYLSSTGIEAIIAPLETRTGNLSGRFEDYTTILYPYLPGKDGYEVKLADQHWVMLGETLKKVHATQLPPDLTRLIPQEAYDPHWRESVKQFQALVAEKEYVEPVAMRLSAFMKSKQDDITHIVRRAEELADALRGEPLERVLCHGDAHPGNYLITEDSRLFLVDWDDPIFAAKERDLMCFGGGMSNDLPDGSEERLFYQGYGETRINQLALAYYRYERIIQDIAEFCKQLLLTDSGSQDREQAYKFLTSSFEPGSVVEAALLTDQSLTSSRSIE